MPIGGGEAVNQLAAYGGILKNASQEAPRIIGGQLLKTLIITYDSFMREKNSLNSLKVGITLTETKIPTKRGSSTYYHNLSVVKLNQGGDTTETIDGLLVDSKSGMSPLITNDYVVSRGFQAQTMYDEIDSDIPQTAAELVEMLQEKDAKRFFHHPRKKVLSPRQKIN